MTAPVAQQASEKIAMTAPVTQARRREKLARALYHALKIQNGDSAKAE